MGEDSTNTENESGEQRRDPPGWAEKFSVAGRGLFVAMSQEKSFVGHFVVTAAVLAAGLALGISRLEWCIIVLCMMAGLSTELLNTAIERLSLAVTQEFNPHIRDALDIASGAVLIISLGASALGALVLGDALWRYFVI